jgi:murein DD-endopeptidase MepM/ murein hydrolase activator NlpD
VRRRYTWLSILIILIVLLVIFFPRIKDAYIQNFGTPPIDTIPEEKPVVLEFGLPVDSFIIIKGQLVPDENLSVLMGKYNIPSTVVEEIVQKSDTVFDLKKMKSGNNYTVFCSKDSLRKAIYFIYEHSPVEYILFDLRDTINVTRNKKEIVLKRSSALINIETSLWNAMKDIKLNPDLALKLSDIFAWTVDFFGLQKGDYFKVIFEEQYVDSVFVGYGQILAACFHGGGRDYYAIPFVQDSVRSYYDEKGTNLRRAFLKAPLKFSRITSGYTGSRYHPILKIFRPHRGVDYAAPRGTPVHSIGDGQVTYAGWSGGGGKMIKISHNSVYATSYMHLSGFGEGIHQGARVAQGQVIGYVGSTGLTTGPHLDFRIYMNGSPVNPLKVEAPPVEPVRKGNMVNYYKVKIPLVEELKKIK